MPACLPNTDAHLQAFNQIRDVHLKRIRNGLERLDRYVALAALDFPNVSPIKTRFIGEDILRPAPFEPERPNGGPNLLLNILHLQQFGDSLVLSIQVITCNDQ